MEITADQLKAGRERLQMTQQQLADEVGVSKRTIGSWERGEHVPRNRLAALTDALGMEGTSEFGEAALRRRIGQLAKQRREEIGLGRVPFSKELGMSDSTLRDLEHGRRIPFGSTVIKVEKGLGWRLGVIDDVMRMTNRKASSIEMQELDAEDSLHLAAVSGVRPLALVSNEVLLDELARRLEKFHVPMQSRDAQELFGLAASTNVEHLEEEGE